MYHINMKIKIKMSL